MLLAGDAGLAARTEALANAESTCCSFFSFEVTPLEDDGVAFEVAVPAVYIGVLAGLVDRAASALGDSV